MKTLRKNIDITNDIVAILQIEGTLNGYGTLKPFLEKIVNDYAAKSRKSRSDVYEKLLGQKILKVDRAMKIAPAKIRKNLSKVKTGVRRRAR